MFGGESVLVKDQFATRRTAISSPYAPERIKSDETRGGEDSLERFTSSSLCPLRVCDKKIKREKQTYHIKNGKVAIFFLECFWKAILVEMRIFVIMIRLERQIISKGN